MALDLYDEIDDDYGLDYDGPLPTAAYNGIGIDVPSISVNFLISDMENVMRNVDPCGPSYNYGIDIYEQTLNYISGLDQR